MHVSNQKSRLGYGPVGLFNPHGEGWLEAPANDWGGDVEVSVERFNPGAVAYRLIREVYLWFGHSEGGIVYTKRVGDEVIIDVSQIAAIH